VLAQRVQDGRQQDAEEFLCLYLDALDEELSALLASIGGPSRQSFSAAQEREVGNQGFVVRQLSHLSALNLASIKNARSWIG
jgi:ubiquitin C-terminal hydrolase